jgi:hypothetical protein
MFRLMPLSTRIFMTFLLETWESAGLSIHDTPRAGGFDDGLCDAQVLQPVARRDQRLAFPAHDGTEVLHLSHDGIFAHDADDVRLERLPPRAVLGAWIGLEPHRRHGQTAVRACDDVAVLVVVARIGLVLLGGLLPAAGARGRVAEQEGSQHPAGEPQDDRCGVLDREAAHRVRGDRLNGDDLAAQHAQVVNLVDHVEQDRPAARLGAPGSVGKVAAGLVEQGRSRDGDQASQHARFDDLTRLGHDRAVRAVVADQHPRSPRLDLAQQTLAFGHRGRDRFFQQHRQVRGDALHGLRRVQLIGRGQHHAVGSIGAKQFVERGMAGHARLSGDPRSAGGGVDHGRQRQRGAGLYGTHVCPPDEAGTRHGNARLGHDAGHGIRLGSLRPAR